MSITLMARMLTIADREATFARRQFCPTDPVAAAHLETIGKTFLLGYRAALDERRPDALADVLDTVPSEHRGFAFEGAGMALALLDWLLPWRRRLRSLLAGRGRAHRYMLHVGAGWARARTFRSAAPVVEDDPLLAWLAVDGYGFHQGYFHPSRYVTNTRRPLRARAYAARAFDQGLGRSLWFVCAADPRRAARAIAGFAPVRHADLWSGLGLAATYAGGASRPALRALRSAAGRYLADVAQGAAFAVTAREEARNPADHTAIACALFCGCNSAAAATLVTEARDRLSVTDSPDRPRYEAWRHSVRAAFGVPAYTGV